MCILKDTYINKEISKISNNLSDIAFSDPATFVFVLELWELYAVITPMHTPREKNTWKIKFT